MRTNGDSFGVGDLGERATVVQGVGNYLVNVTIENAEDAKELLSQLRGQARVYHGPLLPRLEPLVLGNRARELELIVEFCEGSEDSLLYVVGLPGMGKSTVARAAIELRKAETPAVWVTCEGVDADRLLVELDAGLKLDVQAVIGDPGAALAQKISATLGAMAAPALVVLDGFEAVLDEEGRFAASGMAEVVSAFVGLEHPAKLIATSRRLPAGVGKASAGIEVYYLRGLEPDAAGELFQIRAGQAANGNAAQIQEDVLAKLDGHPKFIDLLASAAAELPLETVTEGLLTAADIGDFVLSQVLSQLDESERATLQYAAVFRSAFPFEALRAVVQTLDPGLDLTEPVRRLVRRSIFETVSGPELGYFVHPVLREAAAATAENEAAAHAAAAAWFLRDPIQAEYLPSWDPGLYHLRHAAETGRSEEFLAPYEEFLSAHDLELTYAGWTRRLADEFRHLLELSDDSDRAFLAAWALGITLWQLEDNEEAIEIFESLSEGIREARKTAPDDGELGHMLALVDLKLAESLATQGRLVRDQGGEEEAKAFVARAQELTDEAEEVIRGSDDYQVHSRCAESRFSIARANKDTPEMLRRGREFLAAAERWRDQEPGPQTEDGLAEAYFALGLAEILDGQVEEGLGHLSNQLRIKLAIGKIPGVAAGLLNLGVSVHSADPAEGGAFVLTSRQISREIGQPISGWDEDDLDELINSAVADADSVRKGREAVGGISELLLPYWERALASMGVESSSP